MQYQWEDSSILDYSMRTNPSNPPKIANQGENQVLDTGRVQNWDPKAMLNNLSFLEQKIHRLQELVRIILGRKDQVPGNQDEAVTQEQQLITADLTSIIVQLISTAGSLLPSVNPPPVQLNGVLLPTAISSGSSGGQVQEQNVGDSKSSEQIPKQVDVMELNGVLLPSAKSSDGSGGQLQQQNVCDSKSSEQIPKQVDVMEEDHESKDEDEGKEDEHLPPGSYEILQLEKEEILAPHTHFCTICGKGFKRDANLRMHMRGHGDEYKTAAALAKPNKDSSSEKVILKRYSCPSVGCKRNKNHKKFQPLKTILCVKNHYKRTHCDKSYTCSRCHTKKFSVLADLKTHEKHCGRDKWLCSCGTTFSRKDKLFGHITLFQGHTPAIDLEDIQAPTAASNPAENIEAENINIETENIEAENIKASNNIVDLGFSFGSNSVNGGCIESIDSDPYLSLLSYECDLQDFPPTNYDDSSSSFSFLISGEK